MYDKRIVWVIGVVSLCCLPGFLVLAQSERLQMHIAGTHAVELSELFRIGSLDGPGDAFGQITGVALGRTNRLYVADDLNHDVRVFDFEGQLVRVIGRQGDGPGEFQSPWTIALDDTDSLIVWDQRLARFSIFDPEGAFHRSFAPPRSWLVNSMRFLPEGDLFSSGIWAHGQLGPASAGPRRRADR